MSASPSTTSSPSRVEQFIDGKRVTAAAVRGNGNGNGGGGGGGHGQATHPVRNPATGEILAETDLDTLGSARAAVEAAKRAFPAWSAMPVGDRCQILFKYKQLLEEHFDELAMSIVREHGKTFAEGKGDVRRGIDCVEFACSAPTLMMGKSLPQIAVSTSFCRTEDQSGIGVDSAVDRVPLGVCVGITPFNFPVMVPLWMWPIAVACGNTFVLKPSEKVPLSAVREVELAHRAGLPSGVLNLVTGGPGVVDYLIRHEDVKAVSFVGSTKVAEHVYRAATSAGKRAQCMGGAKNHMVIMPEANRDAAVEGIVGSAFGNSGQRCLAGSVCVAVGSSAEWLVPMLRAAVEKIKVGRGDAAGCAMGPVIDRASRDRIVGFIESGVKDGAELVLDGRTVSASTDGAQGGCLVGPTIFDRVRPGMRILEEEIFGPVLSIVREDSLDAAIATINRSRYGNMAVIFTPHGYDARRFRTLTQVGMVGINVGVPAPMAVFPFAGWKQSFFGDLHANGEDAAKFFTESKVTVTRWL